MMDLHFKNISAEFKDIDEKKGIVSGYLSIFDNKDSDGDVIVKGAFSKTLNENKERIAYLWQHQINNPIGKFLELNEDSKGLPFVAQMSKSTQGKDALILMQEGILKENSIGFNTIDQEQKDGFNEIKEIRLWEGSVVTLAANPLAIIEGVKSQEEKSTLIIERLKALENFIRKGSATDTTYRLIEFEIQQIQKYMTLEIKKPVKPLPIIEPFDLDKFKELINPLKK